ncbi:GMP reductase 1-like protein [Pavlovales sp. CCMP2436]|nr:GMP reductase 1-like protein [Pavlovales sp. CCMP2436]
MTNILQRMRSLVPRAAAGAGAAALALVGGTGIAYTAHVESEVKLDFKDVLIRPKRSTLRSRSEVELARTFHFKHSKQELTCVPLMVANMDTVGTFEMAKCFGAHQAMVAIHKHYTVAEWETFAATSPETLPYVAVSAGTSRDDLARVDEILVACPDVRMICLDVANGYSEFFTNTVREVRAKYPTHTIIAGNVVTNEMTEELILSGADMVKVGIGPGSVCTTRKQAGVGYPQLSAVLECADAAHGLGGHIIADGGITCPGDAAKAFGAGADFIMCGGVFAGHDEAAGELIVKEGRQYKLFYGMSSSTAMEKHVGGVANYRSSEGKTVQVPYKGPVSATILDLLGGLRSACTYVGASTLKEMKHRTTFVRVTQQLNPVFGSHDLAKEKVSLVKGG